ncbi:hypothetical protein [Microbulbifer sp. MCCC 1A16149]|uniref:hypothetical protein n=1 Tax=Microbulbifer sp. MCCC 1A16149 TaxID=3411322 RepID=UPI003D0D1DCA
MTICITCGERKAAILSKECNPCMDVRLRKSFDKSETDPQSTSHSVTRSEDQKIAESSESWNEGSSVSNVGNVIIWLSIASAIACIFIFGRIEVGTGYSASYRWIPGIVISCVVGGLNGVFFGYLLAKLGRVLSHVEALRASSAKA